MLKFPIRILRFLTRLATRTLIFTTKMTACVVTIFMMNSNNNKELKGTVHEVFTKSHCIALKQTIEGKTTVSLVMTDTSTIFRKETDPKPLTWEEFEKAFRDNPHFRVTVRYNGDDDIARYTIKATMIIIPSPPPSPPQPPPPPPPPTRKL